jgi:hypothetical protein
MRNLVAFCCLALCLAAGVTIAQPDNEQKMADKMPSEWLACHISDDCGLVMYNCMNDAFAANKAHLGDAQGVICKTELCAWLQCVPPQYTFSATCEENRCVTKSKPAVYK